MTSRVHGQDLTPRSVFVSGGTGYLGRALIPRLRADGHEVRALVRPGSEKKVVPGCVPVAGKALDASSFTDRIRPSDTFVHLVGVSHPAPWKARQFREVDYASVEASTTAVREVGIEHFVYVSVAHPAPVMRVYWGIRAECEEMIRALRVDATILRPWYVLGPGHWWPLALKPVYAVLERVPQTSASARRLGLVTLEEMVGTLVAAIEHPPRGVRVVEVDEIRTSASIRGPL